ncbi:MAG: hypothetical protein ACXU8A_10860, partial [Burkholderiaceae bacterium]
VSGFKRITKIKQRPLPFNETEKGCGLASLKKRQKTTNQRILKSDKRVNNEIERVTDEEPYLAGC